MRLRMGDCDRVGLIGEGGVTPRPDHGCLGCRLNFGAVRTKHGRLLWQRPVGGTFQRLLKVSYSRGGCRLLADDGGMTPDVRPACHGLIRGS